jgi:hypothetical protein
MELTNCYSYGRECSRCDDSEGVPKCFKPQTEPCSICGKSFDVDVGCIPCEQRNEFDDDIAQMAEMDPVELLLEGIA